MAGRTFRELLLVGARPEDGRELRVDRHHLVVVHDLLLGLLVRVARRGLDAVDAEGLLDLAAQLGVGGLVQILVLVVVLTFTRRLLVRLFLVIILRVLLFHILVVIDQLAGVPTLELLRTGISTRLGAGQAQRRTARMRSMVLSWTSPVSSANTWFATARMYAVAFSRKPMTVSTSTSTGAGASASAAASGAPAADLRPFLPFLLSAGNMRDAPSMHACGRVSVSARPGTRAGGHTHL